MRATLVAAAITAGPLAAPALAVEEADFTAATTGDLVQLCSVQPGEPLYAEARQFCYGYIGGAAHFHRALVQGGDRFAPVACPERQVSRQEIVAVFLDWAEAHPELMNEPPVEGLMRAAAAEWPCNR